MERIRNKSGLSASASSSVPTAPAPPSVPANTKRRSRTPQPPRRRATVPTDVRQAKFDIPMFMTTLILLAFGLGMLLSASYAFAEREHDDSFYFFNRQAGFMALGVFIMLVTSIVDYRIFLNKKFVILLTGAAAVLMLAVKLGGGVEQGGAERWLAIGGITFQPSEILKFVLIVVLAYIAHTYHDRMKYFFVGFLPFSAVIGVACFLTVIQPHLSGTIIMGCIGLTLMTVSNIRFKYVIIAIVGLTILGFVVIKIMELNGYTYFKDRILSWQNPEADIKGATFQTFQSLVAIGSGGWFGLGLGNSRQKFSYLPATHNDFIYSVVCEELGFVGGILVLLLFVIFVLRGFYIASHARDRFGMLLAVGITTEIGIQAFLNIAVATNSVPNTGILLPFFSYGGTALLMQLAQIGILLNVSRRAAIK